MLVLVVYDIQTTTSEGRHRLYQVSKKCESVGRRVQASVFECLLSSAQFRQLEDSLLSIIDPSYDNLRFYNLGNNFDNRIKRHGEQKQEFYTSPIIL